MSPLRVWPAQSFTARRLDGVSLFYLRVESDHPAGDGPEGRPLMTKSTEGMSAERLSTAQVQMRSIYRTLRRSGAVGATRGDLVAATGLSLWQVREAATTMHRNGWIYAAQQVVAGRKVYRYATCWQHWHRS